MAKENCGMAQLNEISKRRCNSEPVSQSARGADLRSPMLRLLIAGGYSALCTTQCSWRQLAKNRHCTHRPARRPQAKL